MIAEMAMNRGDTLVFEMYAPGGYHLGAHVTDTHSLNLIAQGGWDFVVLQEQSQLPAFPDAIFYPDSYEYAEYLDSSIHVSNPCATTLFYQTWGRENGDLVNCASYPILCTYEGMDSMLTLRYRTMAMDFECSVSPVGQVWREVRNMYYPSIQPYSTDGSHPSLEGSYIAASTFYTMIFEKDPSLITEYFGLDPVHAMNILNMTQSVVFDTIGGHKYGTSAVPPSISSIYSFSSSDSSSWLTATTTGADGYYWIIPSSGDTVSTKDTFLFDITLHDAVMLVVTNCWGSDSQTYVTDDIQYNTVEDLKIFPNPTSNMLNIVRANPWCSYAIIDVLGRTYQSGEFVDQIFVGHLASGTYYLLLIGEKGIATRKIFQLVR